MFFELAVVGPIATRGLGMGRQCLACQRARDRYPEEPPCAGFGPGCLGYGPVARGGPAGGAGAGEGPKQ